MKIKLTLATATAIGLMMGTAWAGDNNKTFSVQDGNNNALSVDQDGDWNEAGTTAAGNQFLQQFGNLNSMGITQTGNSNKVGSDQDPSRSGVRQTGIHPAWQPLKSGDRNEIVIKQTSGALNNAANGNEISSIRQISNSNAGSTTNKIGITQELEGVGNKAAHYIGRVLQENIGGAANTLDVRQSGSHNHSGSGGAKGQSNQIGNGWHYGIHQQGTGNKLTVVQEDTGGLRGDVRGPGNVIHQLKQVGDNHEASVTQNGFQNYIRVIDQSNSSNKATITLQGTGNGATLPNGPWAHHQLPMVGMLSGAAGAAAGAWASSVVQGGGSNNQVNYTVFNGDHNQFGFYQNGNSNQAQGILITGNGNELGVSQNGDNNKLLLAEIGGNDNIIGLKQAGTDNVADVKVTGDGNVGFRGFTGGPAGDLAPGWLTPGLLEQSGTFNQVALTVDGSDNVFASLQDNFASSAAGAWNVIVATQNGSENQAAVVQFGNNNTTNLSQTGGMNNASIKQ